MRGDWWSTDDVGPRADRLDSFETGGLDVERTVRLFIERRQSSLRRGAPNSIHRNRIAADPLQLDLKSTGYFPRVNFGLFWFDRAGRGGRHWRQRRHRLQARQVLFDILDEEPGGIENEVSF